jgi:hypothetical protein
VDPGVQAADRKFPIQDPLWYNNDVANRREMGDLRNLIIKGIRESVPRSQNMAKAFDIQQGKDEGPANFLNKLKDLMRKYAGLNLDDPLGQGMLKLHFVTNSWSDITKKLQKIENWKDRNLEELLREAQKVCARWDKEKQRQKAKIMLPTIGQITQEKNSPYYNRLRAPQGVQKGRPKSQTPREKGENKCFRCRKLGLAILKGNAPTGKK